jgi:hypothetical protein
MSTRATDPGDEPAVDQVMLAVLSNRGRNAEALSRDQERLLEAWVAGRLAPSDAARAEALVKDNALAAERVLERRLVTAAEQSPPVPAALGTRVLKTDWPAAKPVVFGGWRRALGRRSWIGLAGAAALASIALVASLSLVQRGPPIQIALATISDRNALFEPSDIRLRGADRRPSRDDLRFRDVEVPTGILKDLSTAPREIEPYLPNAAEGAGSPLRVLLDVALKQRIETANAIGLMPVRIYNLEDPRAADIRKLVEIPPTAGRTYLLTMKP